MGGPSGLRLSLKSLRTLKVYLCATSRPGSGTGQGKEKSVGGRVVVELLCTLGSVSEGSPPTLLFDSSSGGTRDLHSRLVQICLVIIRVSIFDTKSFPVSVQGNRDVQEVRYHFPYRGPIGLTSGELRSWVSSQGQRVSIPVLTSRNRASNAIIQERVTFMSLSKFNILKKISSLYVQNPLFSHSYSMGDVYSRNCQFRFSFYGVNTQEFIICVQVNKFLCYKKLYSVRSLQNNIIIIYFVSTIYLKFLHYVIRLAFLVSRRFPPLFMM